MGMNDPLPPAKGKGQGNSHQNCHCVRETDKPKQGLAAAAGQEAAGGTACKECPSLMPQVCVCLSGELQRFVDARARAEK